MANAGLVLATRQARMFFQEYELTNDLPDNDLAFGTDWPDYADVGYTNGGIGLSVSIDRGTINVDQEFWPVDRPITGGSIRFDTNMAEFSPENLRLASGVGQIETTAPGAETQGYTDWVIGSEFDDQNFSVGFEAVKRDGELFRALIYRGLPVSSPNPRVGQADANAQTAFEVEALPADDVSDHPLAVFRSIIPATGD